MDIILSSLTYLSLVYAGAKYKSLQQQKELIVAARQRVINQSKRYLIKDQIDLTQFRNQINQEHIVYIEIPREKIIIPKKEVYHTTINCVPEKQLGNFRLSNSFLEGQSGNFFSFRCNKNNQTVKVDIKQCNIRHNLLNSTNQPMKISKQTILNYFKVNISMPEYKYQLSGLAVLGSLSYNFENKQFEINPFFLMRNDGIVNNFNSIEQFYLPKIENIKFGKIGVILGIILIFCIRWRQIKRDVTTIYRWFSRLFVSSNKLGGGDFDDFTHIQARASEKLKCRCGEYMNIVSECSHLSMCQNCYQKDNNCRICGQLFKKATRIYV